MKINCDIGERGAAHPVDTALMEEIHIANIACGGHAGDEESVAAFLSLAARFDVEVAAHLSYPDRDNFGRTTIEISIDDLKKSLDDQFALMSDIKMVKFHGALYNDCAKDKSLSEPLSDWLKSRGITRIITQFDSELALSCTHRGIKVVPEAFAERRYAYNRESGKLSLVGRDKDYASIHDLDEALSHTKSIVETQKVSVYVELENETQRQDCHLKAETICIHSDSPISLDLAKSLKVSFS